MTSTSQRVWRRVAVLLGAALLLPLGAQAEKADSEKPLEIESNAMSADNLRKVVVFNGVVVLTKGTIRITADRLVLTEGEKGSNQAKATGTPVRFRQRLEPKDGKEGVWLDGEALRVVYDERTERVELFDKARVTRDGDEVRGDYILYDQRTEFFSARTDKASTSGRVRAIIQPRLKPDTGAPGAPAKRPATAPAQ
jgi:lipopolysaccharide export system protein LptA